MNSLKIFLKKIFLKVEVLCVMSVNSLFIQLSKIICCEPERVSVVTSARDSNTVNATHAKYVAKKSLQSETPVQSPTKQVQSGTSLTIAVDEEETLNEHKIYLILYNTPVSWGSLNQLKLYEEVKDIQKTQLKNVCEKIRDLNILKEFLKKNCQSLKSYQKLLDQIDEVKIKLAIVSPPHLVDAVDFINNTIKKIAKIKHISNTELDEQFKQFATTTEYKLTNEIHYIKELRKVIIQIHNKEIAKLTN